nr:alanine racemase [Microbacterium endophyticum]
MDVDLGTLAANIASIRRRIDGTELMLVVKDDAYAHGIVSVVSRAFAEGVRWFGAFDIASAARVRHAVGDRARIFVWIAVTREEIEEALSLDLDFGVGDAAMLEDVAAAALDQRARVHLKIDTGLHRNGIRPESWRRTAARAHDLEMAGAIEVVGIWSHIAEASDDEDDEARECFDRAVREARAVGLNPSILHLAASAASWERPEFRYDLARVGAYCYGIRPAGGPSEAELSISPVGSLWADITAVGADVTLGIGSLHGLPSTLAGKCEIQTRDGWRRLTRIGDTESWAESWPSARVGEEVKIYGTDAMSATDLAEKIETIGEEIALRVSPIVPRRYV